MAMDFSKLPKLSSSPPPPSEVTDPAQTSIPGGYCTQCGAPLAADMKFCGGCGSPREIAPLAYRSPTTTVPDSLAMDLWIAAIMAVIMLLMGRSFGGYLAATISGKEYNTTFTWSVGPKAGQNVNYWELQGGTGFTESGMFCLGIATLIHGLAAMLIRNGARRPRLMLFIAFYAMSAAVAYNAFAIIRVLGAGVLPLLSVLFAFYGVYVLFQQWVMLRLCRTHQAEAR